MIYKSSGCNILRNQWKFLAARKKRSSKANHDPITESTCRPAGTPSFILKPIPVFFFLKWSYKHLEAWVTDHGSVISSLVLVEWDLLHLPERTDPAQPKMTTKHVLTYMPVFLVNPLRNCVCVHAWVCVCACSCVLIEDNFSLTKEVICGKFENFVN